MRITNPSTTLRHTAAALATGLLLGACWSDIKDQGQNEAGGDVPPPTAYDTAAVPRGAPGTAPATAPPLGTVSPDTGDSAARRDSTPPPGGG